MLWKCLRVDQAEQSNIEMAFLTPSQPPVLANETKAKQLVVEHNIIVSCKKIFKKNTTDTLTHSGTHYIVHLIMMVWTNVYTAVTFS